MKTLSALAFASFLSWQSINAQENVPREKLDLIPSSSSPAGSAVTPNPLPLIPESPEPGKKGKAAAGAATKGKKSSTEAAIDDLQERIRYRQAKTRALNDPAVQNAWDRAHATRTDVERRDALKAYYKLFYARVLRIDGTLKQRVAQSAERARRRLTQTRIDPSEPIDPVERAERFQE
jgi:hypothetical protein